MKYDSKEMKTGEQFVGNTNVTQGLELPAHLSPMKTARIGEQAYDIHGKPLERDYMRPLFIHSSEAELYDRIMMSRLK